MLGEDQLDLASNSLGRVSVSQTNAMQAVGLDIAGGQGLVGDTILPVVLEACLLWVLLDDVDGRFFWRCWFSVLLLDLPQADVQLITMTVYLTCLYIDSRSTQGTQTRA